MSAKVTQGGQALAEGLVAMVVLASIWVAVAWLGRLQDMALSAQHASGLAAFAYTRNPAAHIDYGIRAHYFQGPAHQWKDRSGHSLLASSLHQVQFDFKRASVLSQAGQPGGIDAMAVSLRDDWGIQDEGIVNAAVHFLPGSGTVDVAGNSVLGLGAFNDYPQLRRHTAILEGAGHASNDTRVQQVVAQSTQAWSDSARASVDMGKKVDAAMAAVDAPWHRARPVLDWLSPWAGHVPAARLAHPVKEPE
ncbi:hypothetical protein [Pollutimonas harenae]|uniref:Pilus assembly protein n=1 Tax=Pollutimonas harenae TaxID=657015 RepID=A0A853GUA8_9BURK|nr:hypothetical protein [Pollutimonas harenae]NYT85851.1 hypothetical protein [Pollutimonas harenae]TEA70908.1 hypothetical protein ERD84_09640 [Pollutimonas harenae]